MQLHFLSAVHRTRFLVFAGSMVAGSVLLAACSYLPELAEATGGISTREIVMRVNCELSDAFTADDGRWLPESNEGKFAWLKNWTAQVDLTLQVLDSATLSPGATITEPLKAVAGSAQSFAISANANLNGQAQRIETISYAIALQELRSWRLSGIGQLGCRAPEGSDLRGRLGLREWVKEALSPIAVDGMPQAKEYLWAGIHPKPGSSAPSPQNAKSISPPSVPKSASVSAGVTCLDVASVQDRFDKFKSDPSIKPAYTAATSAQKSLRTAATTATTNSTSAQKALTDLKKAITAYQSQSGVYSAVLNPSLKKLALQAQQNQKIAIDGGTRLEAKVTSQAEDVYAALNDANKYTTDITYLYHSVNSLQSSIDKLKQNLTVETLAKLCGEVTKDEEVIANIANELNLTQYYVDVANNAASSSGDNLKSLSDYIATASDQISSLPTLDPPLQTIGQSVQFILSYGGGATPTWTLVKFKGPNNPFFSVSATRTHILNISVGPAVLGTYKTPSASVVTNQTNLLLNNLLPPTSR